MTTTPAGPDVIELPELLQRLIDWRIHEKTGFNHDILKEAITAIETLRERMASLFTAIHHGDAEHEAWLEQAIVDHFANRPVECSKGMGNRERTEAAEARVAELARVLKDVIELWSTPYPSGGQQSAAAIAYRQAVCNANRAALIILAATPAEAVKLFPASDFAKAQ